jgi:Na+/H+ antiporter NhaD/arsenite permease-like protein
VGNISNIPIIKDYLTNLTKTSAAVYLSSLLTSQIISNVPSAILLAPFTSSSHALFCGVNIGGLGTPVASLASIIAYKLFVHEYPKKSREFLIKFTLWNFISLIILGLVCFFIFI